MGFDESTEAPESKGSSVRIIFNGHPYVVPDRLLTTAELRNLPVPPVSADEDLLQVSPDGDLLIRDDQLVELEDGMQFVAVPKVILAG